MRLQTSSIILCFALTIAISQAYPIHNANVLSSRDAIRIDQEKTSLYRDNNGGIGIDPHDRHHKRAGEEYSGIGVGIHHVHHRTRAPPAPDHGLTLDITPIPHLLLRKRGDSTIPGENYEMPFIPRDNDESGGGMTPVLSPIPDLSPDYNHRKRDRDLPTPFIPGGQDNNIKPLIPITDLPPAHHHHFYKRDRDGPHHGATPVIPDVPGDPIHNHR